MKQTLAFFEPVWSHLLERCAGTMAEALRVYMGLRYGMSLAGRERLKGTS